MRHKKNLVFISENRFDLAGYINLVPARRGIRHKPIIKTRLGDTQGWCIHVHGGHQGFTHNQIKFESRTPDIDEI